MTADWEKYKGIHPGALLDRLLKQRNISQRPFALSLPEHPQTINAITNGKRNLNTSLALKIEQALNLEEGTLMMMQVYYDIKSEKEKHPAKSPDLSILRTFLFWDTDITKIDWEKQYKFVIKRVYERGNTLEKQEIALFYGHDKVNGIIANLPVSGDHITLMPHLNQR